jgi:anti-sigma regulatory factor (Ser/Thr protein kinase)/ketosteroid isomerase-like protein
VTVVPVRSNVVQVERLMSALSHGDDATVLRLVDPAIELVPLAVAAGLVPDAYHGLDGIRAYLGDADAVEVERRFVATRVRGAQDTVVAFGDLPVGAAGDTMPALWLWRLRNGQITHGALVSDECALRAARAAPGAAAPRRAAVRLALPALPVSAGDARHVLDLWVQNLKPTRPERNDLLLAVSEAATNAIRHAYPGGTEGAAFWIHAEISDGRLEVVVTDDGVGLGASSSNPGLGMGLPLLSTLADTLMLVGPPERSRGLEVRMWFAFASLAAQGSARVSGGQPESSGS